MLMKVAGIQLLKCGLVQVLILGMCISFCAGPARAIGGFLFDGQRGIKFGPCLSSMYGDTRDREDVSPNLMPSLGAFLNFPLHRRFEIQTEMLLTVKGLRQNFTEDIPGGSMTFSETGYLLYAELPILLRFPFPNDGVRRTSVYVGPYGAFNLWSHTSGDYHVEGVPTIADGSFSGSIGNVHRFDFGVVAGLDHRFTWGSKTVVLDLRYSHGLRQVFYDLEDPYDVPDGDLPYVYSYSARAKNFKNASLAVTLSLLLKP